MEKHPGAQTFLGIWPTIVKVMVDFALGKLFVKVVFISLGLSNNLKHSYFF